MTTIPETQKDLRREIFRLAWPAVLGNLLTTVKFQVDTKMVGDYADTLGGPEPMELAAMGMVSPMLWSIFSIFTVLSVGTTALVSRGKGEGNQETMAAAVASSLWGAFLVGGLVAVLGGVFTHELLQGYFHLARWVSETFGELKEMPGPAVADLGAAYLRPYLLFFAFEFCAITMMSALRGAGDTRLPMVLEGSANVVNIILNYFLIYGHAGCPQLGLAGAGWATALAGFVVSVGGFMVIVRGHSKHLHVPVNKIFKGSWDMVKRLSRVAFPTGMEQIGFHGAFICFQTLMVGLGTVALATQRICIAVESVCFMSAHGFSMAAATLSGQYLGAGRADLSEKSNWACVRLGVLFFLPLTVLVIVFREPLVAFFTVDPQVVTEGSKVLWVGALEMVPLGMAAIIMGSLRGAGDTQNPMLSTLVSAWVMRLFLGWYFGFYLGYGLVGMWWATLFDWTFRTAWLTVVHKRGKWKLIKV